MGKNTKSTRSAGRARERPRSSRRPPRHVRRGARKREGGEDGFPAGIEGTRGEKDSAWQAQKWREDQRSYPGAEAGSGPAGTSLGALGDTYDAATQRMAQQLPYQLERPEPGHATTAAEFAAQTVGGISISGVRTASQAGNQSVFLLNSDALALVIDVTATAALVGSGRLFRRELSDHRVRHEQRAGQPADEQHRVQPGPVLLDFPRQQLGTHPG